MATEASYKGYRYPVEIISHCVWLYYRFALSLRDIAAAHVKVTSPAHRK